MIRGKGATKEGKLGRAGLPQPGEDEPLHALITGNTPELVKNSVDKVRVFHVVGVWFVTVCVWRCRSSPSYKVALMCLATTMTSRSCSSSNLPSSTAHSNPLKSSSMDSAVPSPTAPPVHFCPSPSPFITAPPPFPSLLHSLHYSPPLPLPLHYCPCVCAGVGIVAPPSTRRGSVTSRRTSSPP